MISYSGLPRSEEFEMEGLVDEQRHRHVRGDPSVQSNRSHHSKGTRTGPKIIIVMLLALALLVFSVVSNKVALKKSSTSSDDDDVKNSHVTEHEDVPTLLPTSLPTSRPSVSVSENPTSTPTVTKTSPPVTLIEKWGNWHFWDNDPDNRPTEDYLAPYPNGDCPYEEFPETAWQGDAVYVNHFLDSASDLLDRAKEAIYAEYGWGPRDDINDDQRMARIKMFKIAMVNLQADDGVDAPPEGSLEKGGWTTKSSFHALSKRLLHAMMTNDSFTVVLGGDSAAAGHGNHFQQSYMMQFHKILEPMFKRLGVKLITRNIAQRGNGPIQNALGASSIYGDNVDMLLWDSSTTDSDDADIELFYRQALIAGKRPPVLLGGNFQILKTLYLNAEADIMEAGSGIAGIPVIEEGVNVDDLPWAARYLRCPNNSEDTCEDNKYRTTCWVERHDVIPQVKQATHAPHQGKEHPGFRMHQLKGRVLAFIIIDALQDAIATWSEETIGAGHPLSDEFWHITSHFENIQKNARALSGSVGKCESLEPYLPKRVCTTPLKARTEFTPRANPDETSITSVLKSAPNHEVIKLETEMLYDGPDLENPSLTFSSGEIDVLTIVSNRRSLLSSFTDAHLKLTDAIWKERYPDGILLRNDLSKELNYNVRRGLESDDIVPGDGWKVNGSEPGNCDGTSEGICGRRPDSDCLLYGHMDGAGGILGNGLSGWLVMDLKNVTESLIILNLETENWSEDNDLIFQYAIDGHITSLQKDEFEAKKTNPQTSVELFTVLDDSDMTNGQPVDIEVAIRLQNCDKCSIRLKHVYWA